MQGRTHTNEKLVYTSVLPIRAPPGSLQATQHAAVSKSHAKMLRHHLSLVKAPPRLAMPPLLAQTRRGSVRYVTERDEHAT